MHPPQDPTQTTPFFPHAKRAPLAAIAAVVITHALLKSVFFTDWFLSKLATPIERFTAGLVAPATLAGTIQTCIVVVGVVVLCGLRPRHLGVTRTELGRIVVVGLVILASTLLLTLILGGRVLSDTGALWLILFSDLLQATLGSSVPEELFYRGLLFVQGSLWMHALFGWSVRRSMISALIVVQVYFALHHIPATARAGISGVEAMLWLFQTALVGGMLAVLFLQTHNLVMAIVAHALLNLTIPVASAPIPPGLIALVMVCLTMLAGSYLFRPVMPPVPTGGAEPF